MRNLMKLLVVSFSFLMVQSAWAGIEMGKVPKQVDLKEKLGGRLDGTPWSSDELQGKVYVLFYVDPDEKDLNNDASEALRNENFPRDKFQSVAVINMDATWLPNFAISSSLKEKQKRYPTTIYVRDYKKVLVKEWALGDDNSDIVAFDKAGKVIFRKDGKLNQQEIDTLISLIRENLDK